MEKILLGMSGGKDSTWACRVLQERGFEVEGLLLVLHSSAPVSEAQRAAERLGIRLHIVDLQDEFKKKVKDYFANEYLSGRTPNPCVECNSKIKFSALLNEANRLGIEKISTGHYVRVGKSEDRYTLSQAYDTKKDQSYFLWQLSQEVLSRFISPLEYTTKDEVVDGVVSNGLIDEVSESQEICFIPDDDYRLFLKEHLSGEAYARAFCEGNFVNSEGKVLGRHKGYASYTVGQRKGLGIALGKPAFVLKTVPDENKVVLGFENENVSDELEVGELNFVSVSEFREGRLYVRPRYRSPLVECEVRVENGVARVKTLSPMKLTPSGQSAVFYDGEGKVVFGGKII